MVTHPEADLTRIICWQAQRPAFKGKYDLQSDGGLLSGYKETVAQFTQNDFRYISNL